MISVRKQHTANGKTFILEVNQKLFGGPEEHPILHMLLITTTPATVYEVAPYHIMIEAEDQSPLVLGSGSSSLTGCCGKDAVRTYLWAHGPSVLKAQVAIRGDDRIKLFAKHHADGRLELRGIHDELASKMVWENRQPIW